MTDPEAQGGGPPLPVRLLARGSSALIARAPFLWPLMRRPTERFWQRAARGWDARINPDGAEHLAPLAAACERIPAAPAAILELGTGTGSGATMLARRFPGATVVGVDLSGEMIARATEKLPGDLRDRVRFEVADAAALTVPGAGYDLVCQLNLPLFAGAIARATAPGGHVVVASSRGPGTPYYTPDRVVRRSLGRRGIEVLEAGRAGSGTYLLARRR